uniref:Vitellogenin-1 n=1 Tax=Dermanyssus gallinae TaxID=34641 RepID=A0A0M4FBG8_9ACAR|nr:vitellogenin-1 [Dermanyssus gallinae]WOF76305.1 vitellogenin 1 [Dermanyssus gallinae]
MRFFVLPLLLAAAASAEVFHFVGQHGQGSTVYGVRGAVTVGAHQLTAEKTALEYNGTLAVEQIREGEFLTKFTHFTVGKYNKLQRSVQDETFDDLTPEEQRVVKTLREPAVYEPHMQRPVRFFVKEGQIVRMEAEKEHPQWSLNIFRSVLTLFQNQVSKPATLAVPHVEYKYEDGITGNCKVQYEVFSLPEDVTVQGVFNLTKTKNYKDCLGRPVYLHLKDTQRGCAGVCDNHRPENFLAGYEEEITDYELKPTPGCPVNQQRKDTLVTVQTVTKYNVSNGYLDEVRSEHTDIYRLYGGKLHVFTTLQLRLYGVAGPKIEEPKTVEIYKTLQLRLPHEEDELDIPVYALLREHTTQQQYGQHFQKYFEAVVQELLQLKDTQKQGQPEKQHYHSTAYLVELVQAVSSMTEKELKSIIPTIVHQAQPKQLTEEEHVRRQLWVELLGKAGSKSAVKIIVELVKGKLLTPTEIRRVLQDVAAFQSYPDTEMVEQILALCVKEQGLTATGKATACVAAGKVLSKACNSKVYQLAQKHEQHKKTINGKYQSIVQMQEQKYTPETEPEAEEYRVTFGHLPVDPKLVCTPEKLQKYVSDLSHALHQATDFKHVVAYINGLAHVQKPEVLPELLGYVNGTASNLVHIHEQGEDIKEAVEFARHVAIVSLQHVAVKYPKEVNPIVRVVFENTTEKVQTRILAFDVWMDTQPAQWEVEKVMQIANKDSSLELTHYVYTALKTAMKAEEPCYQLLAQRVRAAWTQLRPFDLGSEFSHLRSKFYYDTVENYGIRGVWKVIASNTTILPFYTEAKVNQVRGPYKTTLFGAKLLVKGGDKVLEELVGKDGLLERIAYALVGQIKTGPRQQNTEQLLKDIAQGMGLKREKDETPKAVLFWKLFSGDAVIPLDSHYINELKQELLQTVTKFGKDGVTGHIVRVLVPTKAFHVEPSTIGLPIVHSTIHPVVLSVRYENIKIHYGNQESRVAPKTLEISGTVQPTILSFRQSRVFVSDKVGQKNPTVKTTDIKEFNVRLAFRVVYEHTPKRFRVHVKPVFDRVFHSGHCTELKLESAVLLKEELAAKTVEYDKCIKSLYQPIRRNHQIAGEWSGMMLRLTGESHQPWSGLPMFAPSVVSSEGILGAIINRLSNKGMKHHTVSLYLETNNQQPITEWVATIDVDSNVERLAKVPLSQQITKVQKLKVQYANRAQPLYPELEPLVRKVESLLEKFETLDETTVEKLMLVKIEGLYQGQPKSTLKIAMKKIYNLEKTEQQYALAAMHQESHKGLELSTNVSYPKIGSPFRYDPTFYAEDERMNGTLIVKLQSPQEQVFHVKFQATKSEEQLKETEYEWFEVRCLAEQKAGKIMTDACRKAVLKDNSLDQLKIAVTVPRNVHPKIQTLAYKTLDLMKYMWYPKMQTEVAGLKQREVLQALQHTEREVRISVNATRESLWHLLYDVRVEMPFENVTFSKVNIPGVRPAHMQLTTKEQLEHVYYRGQKDNVCVLGDKSVRTYDNVTFGLDVKTGCEYVLTRDTSSGTPDFTVTFQVVKPDTFAKKIRVQLENTLVELEPFTTTDRYITVVVNGTQYQITFEKPVVFEYAAGKRVFLNVVDTSNVHHAPVITLYTEPKEVRVFFDGHSAKVFVVNKYKGNTKGVCGNNDNEQAHEFIGPNGKEYQHANEFIASYGIGQACKVPAENTREKLMETLKKEVEQIRRQELIKKEKLRKEMQELERARNPQWMEQQEEQFWGEPLSTVSNEEWTTDSVEEQQLQRQVLKTAMSIENGHICFSARPIATCKQGYKNHGVLRTERVESICLEKNEEAAIQAVQEIRAGQVVNIKSLEPYQKGRLFTMHKVPRCERHD